MKQPQPKKKPMSNYKIFLPIVLSLMFIPYEYAYCGKGEKSPVEKMWQRYCVYQGIFKDESRWIEEFQMLEEPSDHPNYEYVSSMLGIFMTMPDDLVARCPSLKKYLSELIRYHTDNTHITKDTEMILDFLQRKLANADDVSLFKRLISWLDWY